MESITVTVPIPPKFCDPNNRTKSHGQRISHIARGRTEGRICAMAAIREQQPKGMPWPAATVLVRWYHPTKSFRDVQNIIATLKPMIDGFEDAGIFRNDRELSSWTVERLKDAKNRRVEITITKLEAK